MSKETRALVSAFKRRRESEGLSLRKAAELVGVSFSTLSRIESHENIPDANTKVRLLNWLGPEAHGIALNHEHVADVHFRAAKQVDSETISHLMVAAKAIKQKLYK